jgi:histidinol dehydrogenase
MQELPNPQLPEEVTAAFDTAYANIRAFHEAQCAKDLSVETMPGVVCRRLTRAINAVGLYVPGGTAVLPSSALMLAVPAQIAGCGTIVLATPPRPDGSVTPEVLYCAKKAGVTHILKAGGAQAVAAMAWGTKSCPKVDKIMGPGNQYVTAAKMLLTNSEAMIAIDMPAGPSEVLVIADAAANPAFVAADLLSQAEHGPDSQVVLLALPGLDLDAVQAEVDKQCNALPRNETARKALSHSCIVQVRGKGERDTPGQQGGVVGGPGDAPAAGFRSLENLIKQKRVWAGGQGAFGHTLSRAVATPAGQVVDHNAVLHGGWTSALTHKPRLSGRPTSSSTAMC